MSVRVTRGIEWRFALQYGYSWLQIVMMEHLENQKSLIKKFTDFLDGPKWNELSRLERFKNSKLTWIDRNHMKPNSSPKAGREKQLPDSIMDFLVAFHVTLDWGEFS